MLGLQNAPKPLAVDGAPPQTLDWENKPYGTSPDPLAGFGGAASQGDRGKEGRGREEYGMREEESGGRRREERAGDGAVQATGEVWGSFPR